VVCCVCVNGVCMDCACVEGGGVCGEGMFVCVEWCVHDVLDVCVEDICRVWCVYMRVCFYGWCLLVYLCGEFVSLEGVCVVCAYVSVCGGMNVWCGGVVCVTVCMWRVYMCAVRVCQ